MSRHCSTSAKTKLSSDAVKQLREALIALDGVSKMSLLSSKTRRYDDATLPSKKMGGPN